MRYPLLILALLLALPAAAGARPVRQPNRWAVGLNLGHPTGLSVKHYMGGSDAFDLAIGGGPGMRVHGDYLFGLAQVLSNTSDLSLDLYLGPGVILGVDRDRWCGWYGDRRRYCGDEDGYLGARVAFGLDFVLRRAPVSFGLELAPAVLIDPDDVDGFVDGLLFVRFLL